MPNQVNDELEQLKKHQNLIRVYNQYTKLTKEGDKFRGLCPLHSEKSGSFVVYAKDLLYHCFGCNASGNAIQLVQQMDNISFKDAVKKVQDAVGGNWERQKEAVEATFKPVIESNKTYKTFTLDQISKFETNLKNSKAAQDHLASRGISLETATRLHTGYVQSIKVPDKDKDIADQGWLVFPTIEGDVVTSVKYRSIARKAFSKQGGMATCLYNTNTIDVFEDLYLVEGEFDALTLEQAGFHAVSLASASSHPTPEQKDMLMKANRLFLAGDCDGAVGDAIMQKLWTELEERTFRLKWPDGHKDANEVFLQKCKGNVSIFQTEVDRLSSDAVKQPLPDVYSLQEVMTTSQQGSLADHPLRLRFPQPDVDKMAILLPGSVWSVYATQTGMGKTPFILQTMLHNAMHHGARVLIWQCELTPEEIATIVTAQLLRKDRNTLSTEDKKQAASIMGEIPFYIGHNPGITDGNAVVDLIEAAIKRLSITHVVLDTFNNVVVSESNGTAVETALANRIKNTNMKYKTIWGNVLQPRKAQQQSKGKKTHITDIRGAGAVADTSDAVFAIHRELYKGSDDSPSDDVYEAKTLIQAQKTRAKGTGKAETYLHFYGCWALFEQIDYAHSDPE